MSLLDLRQSVKVCERCPLYREKLGFPNIGVGSTNPDFLFVLGGIDNSEVDKPFNSRDEMVLLTALKNANIDKSRCYVTSIIKCGNITYNKKHVSECIGWLSQEIFELKPKGIFFLSEVAHKIFLKTFPSNTIKTYSMSAGLAGIFNRNSLFKDFVARLVQMNNDLC